ncbi:MAG: hypothetical protein ACXVEE_32605 [Polyangiales bacterium]
MSDSLPPLDDELRSLLSAERSRPPVPPAVRSRLLSRVDASLAAGAGAAAGIAIAAKSGTKAWVVVLAFALGGLAGAGVTWLAKQPTERVVEKRVEVPTVVTVTVTVPASVPVVPPSVPPTAAPPATSLAQPPSSVGSAAGSAADERNLIDAMRTALKAGDPAGALGFVSAHEKRFPTGAFTEEREAYAVQALARSGRGAEAKARGDRFRKRYPSSLLLPIVDQATSDQP